MGRPIFSRCQQAVKGYTMPSASSHIYRIVLNWVVGTQNMSSVWHYRGVSPVPPDPTQILVDEFEAIVLGPVQNVTHENANFVSITGENLTATTPVVVSTLSGKVGQRSGARTSGNVAVSFKYNRASRDIRSGWKRFGPLSEDDTFGDTFIAAYTTICQATALVLEQDLTIGGDVYQPIVIRKPTAFPAASITYVNVASVEHLDRVTTQNSRKAF